MVDIFEYVYTFYWLVRMKKKEKRHSFTTNCGCKWAVKKIHIYIHTFLGTDLRLLVCKTNVKNKLYIFHESYKLLEHFPRIFNILLYMIIYVCMVCYLYTFQYRRKVLPTILYTFIYVWFIIYIHFNIVENYLPI